MGLPMLRRYVYARLEHAHISGRSSTVEACLDARIPDVQGPFTSNRRFFNVCTTALSANGTSYLQSAGARRSSRAATQAMSTSLSTSSRVASRIIGSSRLMSRMVSSKTSMWRRKHALRKGWSVAALLYLWRDRSELETLRR